MIIQNKLCRETETCIFSSSSRFSLDTINMKNTNIYYNETQ